VTKYYTCHGVHFLMRNHQFVDLHGVYLWYSKDSLLVDLQANGFTIDQDNNVVNMTEETSIGNVVQEKDIRITGTIPLDASDTSYIHIHMLFGDVDISVSTNLESNGESVRFNEESVGQKLKISMEIPTNYHITPKLVMWFLLYYVHTYNNFHNKIMAQDRYIKSVSDQYSSFKPYNFFMVDSIDTIKGDMVKVLNRESNERLLSYQEQQDLFRKIIVSFFTIFAQWCGSIFDKDGIYKRYIVPLKDGSTEKEYLKERTFFYVFCFGNFNDIPFVYLLPTSTTNRDTYSKPIPIAISTLQEYKKDDQNKRFADGKERYRHLLEKGFGNYWQSRDGQYKRIYLTLHKLIETGIPKWALPMTQSEMSNYDYAKWAFLKMNEYQSHKPYIDLNTDLLGFNDNFKTTESRRNFLHWIYRNLDRRPYNPYDLGDAEPPTNTKGKKK
jgi:hypothetical protein